MANLTLRRRGGTDDDPIWLLRKRVEGRDYYRTLHGTRAAAEAALATFGEETTLPSYGGAMRFRAFAETWISRHMPGLANQTATGYRTTLDRHLLPAIGDKMLVRITLQHALRLQDSMHKAKLSAATIAHALRLGRTILAEAARFGVIQQNPWLEARQKQRRKNRVEVPDYARAIQMLAGEPRTDLTEILRLALESGLRRGEILALRWRYVAADFSSVEVRGSIELVDRKPQWKEPKSDAGYRRISLPVGIAQMLRQRFLRLGRPDAETPVFARPGGGNAPTAWMDPDLVSQNARNRLRKLGLASSIHALRHAHASYLVSAGVTPLEVARRLGHAHVSVTLGIYGHLQPGDDARALAVLNAASAA